MKKNFSAATFFILILGISTVGLSGCKGPEIPNDQMKVTMPGTSPQPPTQQQTETTPLKGKDLMIDQTQTQAPTQNTAGPQQPAPNQPQADSNTSSKTVPISATTASITTNRGVIKIKLYPQETPQTVQNFLLKAQANYYKNLTFHRVEDWVIQGGDPLGNGTGGGNMPTELSQTPFKEGSVGVARGGNIKISNDSQFFICTKDCSWLSGQYTNFGEVIEGMDVAKQTQIGDKILSISYE